MLEISQTAMLNDMDITTNDNDEPRKFSITYISKQGICKEYPSLSKNYKPISNSEKTKTNNYRVKEKGIRRLYDHTDGEEKSFIIDFITHYNGALVV